jgi:4-hydroxythreonine-4-phosphate dehydrogenase
VPASAAKATIAIAVGDPAGIGPEISLKAAIDPLVRSVCNPILVGDASLLARHAKGCGIEPHLRAIERIDDADWSRQQLNVLACEQPELARLEFGAISAAAGRASLVFAHRAITAACAGEVDAVVAAPHNETSIACAGVAFDGYPSFVARVTGTQEDDVFLMLCFDHHKVVHATLHLSVRDAIAMITPARILRAVRATGNALQRLGVTEPDIAVGGLNPHAGEGGLFGREEIEIIAPAIADAAAQGLKVSGPFAVDTMFHMRSVDAFIVMLHDHGHIAAKLLAPRTTAALTIGTPILFSSVAHGSAHDIAGKGLARPTAMIEALMRLARAQRAS